MSPLLRRLSGHFVGLLLRSTPLALGAEVEVHPGRALEAEGGGDAGEIEFVDVEDVLEPVRRVRHEVRPVEGRGQHGAWKKEQGQRPSLCLSCAKSLSRRRQ